MSKLQFKRTHRLLLKSTEIDFKYFTVEIDVNSGTYKKAEVDSADTLIRINKGVFGEQLGYGQNSPLSVEDIELLEAKVNAIRAEKEWHPLTFRKSKEVLNEVSNSSQVQGQEEAETV